MSTPMKDFCANGTAMADVASRWNRAISAGTRATDFFLGERANERGEMASIGAASIVQIKINLATYFTDGRWRAGSPSGKFTAQKFSGAIICQFIGCRRKQLRVIRVPGNAQAWRFALRALSRGAFL